MISIVDTDYLMGILGTDDALHKRSIGLSKKFEDKNVNLLVTTTTLAEFSLVGLKKFGREGIKKLHGLVSEGNLDVVCVDERDVEATWDFYDHQLSKKESWCDCVVMAVAKRVGADFVTSFDRGYKKNGFKLAEDMV